MRATVPVFIGDTVHVVATVTSFRSSKSHERGVTGFKYVVRNQRDEDVLSFDFTLLMRSRQAAV